MHAPHATPFHDRPDVMVGDIIPFEDAAYQTILAREEGGHTRHPLGAAGGRAFYERSPDVGTASGRRGHLPLAIQAASMATLKALVGAEAAPKRP